MKMVLRAMALGSIVLLSPFAAHAAGGLRQACKDDVQTFCKDIQPGGGRILNCIKDHEKDISDACYDAVKNPPARGARQDNTKQDSAKQDNTKQDNASQDNASQDNASTDDNLDPSDDKK